MRDHDVIEMYEKGYALNFIAKKWAEADKNGGTSGKKAMTEVQQIIYDHLMRQKRAKQALQAAN